MSTELLGYLSSGLIGVSLGLLGAGGSILTVPVLIYCFKLDTFQAIRHSLFVVGLTSAGALVPRLKKQEIMVRQGIIFAVISMAVTSVCRKYIIPEIPAVLFSVGKTSITFSMATMLLFALLMLCAATAMIGKKEDQKAARPAKDITLILTAASTGLLTGFLGAGGGFIIVPALMLFFGMDTRKAVGTSLLIIFLNAFAGFLSDLGQSGINWNLLFILSALSLCGSFLGQRIASGLNTEKLRKSFGYFVAAMAIIILTIQLVSIA